MKCVNNDHKNGRIWEGDGFMVFEDTQEAKTRYYGWLGTWEDHDTAKHIDFDSLDEAESALSLTIHLTDVIEYYDGSIIFEGRDSIGGYYIGVTAESAESDEPGDLYAIIGVEQERLDQFKNGSLDLLALIAEREETTWYTGIWRKDSEDLFWIKEQTKPIVETYYLPAPGSKYPT